MIPATGRSDIEEALNVLGPEDSTLRARRAGAQICSANRVRQWHHGIGSHLAFSRVASTV